MLAVLGALFANALITVLKFAAAVMTGSSGMMAEALHSLAIGGTCNAPAMRRDGRAEGGARDFLLVRP